MFSKRFDFVLNIKAIFNRTIEGQDPVTWAASQVPIRTIEGQDPIEWAVNQDPRRNIAGMNPIIWAIEKINTELQAIKKDNQQKDLFENKLEQACNLLSKLRKQELEQNIDRKNAIGEVVKLAIERNIHIGTSKPGAWAMENGFDTDVSLRTAEAEHALLTRTILQKSNVLIPIEAVKSGASGTERGSVLDSGVFVKSLPTNVNANIENITGHQAAAVNEYLYGYIYEKLLFQRTPKVQLVVEDANIINKGEYVVTSPGGSKTVRDIKAIEANSVAKQITITSRELTDFQAINGMEVANIKGFEKVLAACLILGENDYHNENIGVTRISSEEERVAAKIDHGYSGSLKYENVADMMNDMVVRFRDSNYLEHSLVKLDAEALKAAIDEMIKTLEGLGKEGIRDLFLIRATALRNAGISVADSFINDQVELIMQNVKVAKELSEHLGVVISTKDNDKIKGGWFEEFEINASTTRKLPVQVKTIALQHERSAPFIRTIKVPKLDINSFSELPSDSKKWTLKQTTDAYNLLKAGSVLENEDKSKIIRAMVDKRHEVGDFSAIRYAIDNKIQIDEKDAHIWALTELPADTPELRTMIAKKIIMDNVKCGTQNAVQYLNENNIMIGTFTAQEWADKQLLEKTSRYPPDVVLMNNLLESGANAEEMSKDTVQKLTKTFEIMELIDLRNSDWKPGFADMVTGVAGDRQIKRPIANVEKVSEFMKGLGSQDPVTWAIEKGFKIANKNPIIWELENSQPPLTERDDIIQDLNKKLNNAIKDGKIEVVKVILEAANEKNIAVDLLKFQNPDMFNKTSLHTAAEYGGPEMVKVILDFAKQVNATKELLQIQDENDDIPLHTAVERGDVRIIGAFLDSAKSVNEYTFIQEQLMSTDIEGNTTLHLATKSGKTDVVQSIVEVENVNIGSLLEVKNEAQERPIDCAPTNSKLDIQVVLIPYETSQTGSISSSASKNIDDDLYGFASFNIPSTNQARNSLKKSSSAELTDLLSMLDDPPKPTHLINPNDDILGTNGILPTKASHASHASHAANVQNNNGEIYK